MLTISPKEGAKLIEKGHVIAYPTECVYSIGCDPFITESVENLLELKGRRYVNKGLVLIVSNIKQAEELIDCNTISSAKYNFERLFTDWPENTTFIFPASKFTPTLITMQNDKKHARSIAIRLTSHPVAKIICDLVGKAIISTSGNISNCTPAKTIDTLQKYFDGKIKYVVCGDLGNFTKTSTIIDVLTGNVVRC